MYGLSLVANPAIPEVSANYALKGGVLRTPLTVVDSPKRGGKAKVLPVGTAVRFYKGSGPEQFKQASPRKVAQGNLWLVEVAPPPGQAWLVYSKDAGLPDTYAKTWEGSGPGWNRVFYAGWKTGKPTQGGYPDVFAQQQIEQEVLTKSGGLEDAEGAGKTSSDSYRDLEEMFKKSNEGQSDDPLADGSGKGKGGGSPGGIIPVPGLKVPGSNIFIPWLVVAGAGVGLALNAPLGLALIGAGLIQDARS